jgi:hypothetical protein
VERAALEEAQLLKSVLAKARADTSAAVALVFERSPTGLCGSWIDFVRVSVIVARH